MATTLMQIRLDSETKKAADALFADLGLDTSTAVRIFIKKALSTQGLPFAVKKSTQKSAEELEEEAFYSPENVAKIKESYEQFKAGNSIDK